MTALLNPTDEHHSIIGSLLDLSLEEQEAFLSRNPDVAEAIRLGPNHYEAWPYWAFGWQLIDWDEDWDTILSHCGRGAGKTAWLSHAVDQAVHDLGVRKLALIGENAAKTVSINVNGASGIVACSRTEAKVGTFRYGQPQVTWANGAECAIGYAVQPNSTRGLDVELVLGDEIAFWQGLGLNDTRDPMTSIVPALRQGMSRMILGSTANMDSYIAQKALKAIKDRASGVIVHQVPSETNVFINQEATRRGRSMWAGTDRERQEYDGEIIINEALTIWSERHIHEAREYTRPPGPYDLVVISLDPNKKKRDGNDPAGIVVGGINTKDRKAAIFHAEDGQWTPRDLFDKLSELAYRFNADELLVEDNALGDFFLPAMAGFGDLPMRMRGVTAVDEKRLRASDALTMYQQRRVVHFDDLVKLETQMLNFTGDDKTQKGHDDMVDALSHLLREYLLPPKKRSIYDFR